MRQIPPKLLEADTLKTQANSKSSGALHKMEKLGKGDKVEEVGEVGKCQILTVTHSFLPEFPANHSHLTQPSPYWSQAGKANATMLTLFTIFTTLFAVFD